MENSDLQPRSAKATDMIQVEPQVLRFQRPFNVARAQTVTVANRSPERIAFKVKTTAPKMYLVRPNCGVLGAGEHCVVSSTAAGRRKSLGERRRPLLTRVILARMELRVHVPQLCCSRSRDRPKPRPKTSFYSRPLRCRPALRSRSSRIR